MDAIILDLGKDVKGECSVEGYKDKLEVLSYSHHVALQVTNDVSATERVSGKAYVGEFSISKYVDSSTPTLNDMCCYGKSVPTAILTIARNSGTAEKPLTQFLEYTLSNVIISSVSVSGGAGGKPSESLTLNFTKIKWTLSTQNADGSKEGSAAAVWDIVGNTGKGG